MSGKVEITQTITSTTTHPNGSTTTTKTVTVTKPYDTKPKQPWETGEHDGDCHCSKCS